MIALRSSGICAGIDEDSVAELAAHCRLVEYGPNSPLFREGMPADGAYVLLSGRVKQRRLLGTHEVLLCILRAGDLPGLASAVDGGLRSADAITMEPSELLFLPRGALREWMGSDAVAACAVAVCLARESRVWHRYPELREGRHLARACAALLENEAAGRPRLRLAVLGALIGTGRQGAWRIVERLEKVSAVSSGDHGVEVLDAGKLRRLIEQDRR